MSPWLYDLIFSLNRWVHILGTTVLLGGVFFFRLVVPVATAHLKDEQQLAVFGQARWVFRRVVWASVLALLLSGAISVYRVWPVYIAERAEAHGYAPTSLPWAAAHLAMGLAGIVVIFRVTATRRLRERPIFWLTVTLALLVAAVLFASAARELDLRLGFASARW